MTKESVHEEQVETSSDGEPVYGYRIEKQQLPAFIKKIKELTHDQCMFATKEDGDFVKVVVFPAGNEPSKEFDEGMAQLQDATEFATYRSGTAETEVDF